MKFSMEFRPDIVMFIGISIAGILIGLAVFLFIEPFSVFGAILVLSGIIGFVTALFTAWKPQFDLAGDERMIQNSVKAGYHTFLILMYIAGITILLRMLGLSPSLTPSHEIFEAANNLLSIGFLSYFVVYRYLEWKGE